MNLQAVYTLYSENINILNNKPWLKGDDSQFYYSSRICSCLKYNNKLYLVTMAHDLSYSSDDYLQLKSHRVKLDKNKKIIIPEIDILIYKLDIELDFLDLNKNKSNIDDVDENLDLFLLSKSFNEITTNILFCDKIKYGNACYPEMLQFIGSLNCNPSTLKGSSGSPIYDKEGNIYGFLSGNSNFLNICPMFYIKRILKEIDKFGFFNGFCRFYCETKFTTDKTFVKKTNNLDYNIYCKSMNHKISRLLKDDILLELDGKNIHQGNIYCDEIGMPIDIDSYIMITKTINDINIFKIKREKNKTKIFNIITGNRDIYSSLDIDIRDDALSYDIIKNRIYIKINPELFKLLTNFRQVEEDDKILSLLNPKISNLKKNNYLLVEDLILKTSIFKCKLSNYIVK